LRLFGAARCLAAARGMASRAKAGAHQDKQRLRAVARLLSSRLKSSEDGAMRQRLPCPVLQESMMLPVLAPRATEVNESVHRGRDDLLSAGLGLAGLRRMVPLPFQDPAMPTAAEQRRRAIWSNWRGIADIAREDLRRPLRDVPGREFHALLRLPDGGGQHRVMLQLPDDFDPRARCLLVTASSGSRGIYGAISVAGAWGLPRGCAVVYTDKGCGCDWFDMQTGSGFALDGTLTDDPARQVFKVATGAGPTMAIRHAQSGINPEADWGRHVLQAAEFALEMLSVELPAQGRFDFGNTRVVGVGISNGAAAVLRAAEAGLARFSGVVAASPNIHSPTGGRALYDYGTEAALWMTAAHAAPELAEAALPTPLVSAAQIALQREAACLALQRHGMVDASDPDVIAAAAYRYLRSTGWTDAALHAGVLSSALDMWRALGVTYSWSYGGFGATHPHGYRFGMLDADGRARPAEAVERALWWSEGSGIMPSVGAGVIEPAHDGPDPWSGMLRLRGLLDGDDAVALQVQDGIARTRAELPVAGLPMLLMHGIDDGLIPEAFSSAPYVQACRHAGRPLTYWRLPDVQHFDGFLALPSLGSRYRPLLPALHRGLDAMWAHLSEGMPIPQAP
jgi:hydroxybutyrate-dimer hydrolase